MSALGRLVQSRSVLRSGVRNAYIYTEKNVFGCIGTRALANPAQVNSEHPIFRNTEIDALVEKAKGDWKQMTPDEVKKLYKVHFLESVADSTANTGECWRLLGQTLFIISITSFMFMAFLKYTGPMKGISMNYRWHLKEREHDIRTRDAPFDFERAELRKAMEPDLERQRQKMRAELQLEEKYRARVAAILAEGEKKK